ncbi:MAG: fibronectin type III domain-containing protein [Gammaproteobacteria bacterium]|nr:fibronectin type III domain-containing protein [Gammaproteobacteria bacterium]
MSRLIPHPNSFLRLTLAVLAALALAAPAAAQAETLVSNLGQTNTGGNFVDNNFAQQFTTGGHVGGYFLSAIVVPFANSAPSGLTVKVGTGTAQSIAGKSGTNCDSLTGDSCVTLTNPSSFAIGNNTFTAPAGTVLSASTTYVVVVEGTGQSIGLTSRNFEDFGGAAGWSIADDGLFRGKSATGAFSSSSLSMRIRVEGTATTAPPAPPAPSVSTASTTSLRVAWRPPSSDGGRAITDYDVRWKERFQADTEWTEIADTTASVARHTTLTGLSAGKTYDVQVRAQNAVGNGAWSASARGTTYVAPANAESLDPPGTTCSGSACVAYPSSAYVVPGPGAGQVTLHWDWSRGTGGDLDSWEVWVLKQGTSSRHARLSGINKTARSHTVSGLQTNQKFRFSLIVVNGHRNRHVFGH